MPHSRFVSPSHVRPALLSIAAFLGMWVACDTAAAQDRLIDREPFDRVVLDAANQNRRLDILPGSFPERTLPDPLPRSGTLRVRLVERPLDEFEVRWSAITEVLLFEQLVLEEAKQLARDGDFPAAHDYLAYLRRYHADLPGLEQAVETTLELEIADAYGRGDYERAWMVLTALYDRNPQHAGISRAFDNVTGRLLQMHVASGEFGKARRFVELLQTRFGDLGAAAAEQWENRLRRLAEERLQAGQAHFEEGRLDEARDAVRSAMAVLPDLPEARVVWRQIASAKPRLVVGVLAEAPDRVTRRLDDWPSRRIASLVDPPLVELQGFGAEGGEYRSAYGEVLQEAGGAATRLVLPRWAGGSTPAPHAVARQLIAASGGSGSEFHEVLADQLAEVAIEDFRTLRLQWRHAQVRPEALLRVDVTEGDAYGPFELRKSTELRNSTPDETTFVRKASRDAPPEGVPLEIVERLFASEDDALNALVRGEIDIVERITPSQRARASQQPGVQVGQYSLPTLHVLIPSANRPAMQTSELRRAILYGIDRQAIAQQLFYQAGPTESASVVSGPFPPGSDFTDPVGYAYNRAVEPRPSDVRLAATLASVAARLHNVARDEEPRNEQPGEARRSSQEQLPELVLGHPREPLARAICQTIASQLETVGISIRLEEVDADEWASRRDDFDLRYAELAMWEPVVDALSLFGPRGGLAACSPRMGLALMRVGEARTWPEVRASLQEVHRVAFDELSVIPLWQTTNYFAYADGLRGIPSRPVTLYQNVESWRLERAMEVPSR